MFFIFHDPEFHTYYKLIPFTHLVPEPVNLGFRWEEIPQNPLVAQLSFSAISDGFAQYAMDYLAFITF